MSSVWDFFLLKIFALPLKRICFTTPPPPPHPTLKAIFRFTPQSEISLYPLKWNFALPLKRIRFTHPTPTLKAKFRFTPQSEILLYPSK